MHFERSADVIHAFLPPQGGSERKDAVARARKIVAEAMRLMQADCEACGRGDVWAFFVGRLLPPELGGVRVRYLELAIRWKVSTPVQAEMLFVLCRRMFTGALRKAMWARLQDEGSVDRAIDAIRAGLRGVC